MTKTPGISAAIRFIKRAHKGQKDMSGKPYWTHPVRVMERLGPSASVVEKQAALLHDVVEDTKITLDDLRNAGFRADVLAAVALLTRPGNLTYQRYIGRLVQSGNIAALRVKLADLLDNMDPSRAISDGGLHARLLSRHRQAEKRIRKHLGRTTSAAGSMLDEERYEELQRDQDDHDPLQEFQARGGLRVLKLGVDAFQRAQLAQDAFVPGVQMVALGHLLIEPG
ncbi:MAG: HD domain-containing protein [Elusimicrobia bacterium]|nr:HD domain-containing protein [Elusimicrobiota bacterium]